MTGTLRGDSPDEPTICTWAGLLAHLLLPTPLCLALEVFCSLEVLLKPDHISEFLGGLVKLQILIEEVCVGPGSLYFL